MLLILELPELRFVTAVGTGPFCAVVVAVAVAEEEVVGSFGDCRFFISFGLFLVLVVEFVAAGDFGLALLLLPGLDVVDFGSFVRLLV